MQERIIKPYIDLSLIAKKEVNFKSKLIEWSQKNKVDVEFALVESFTDHENNPVFQFQALLAGISGGVGIGYSKKESQQNAAQMALKKIKTDKSFLESVLESQILRRSKVDAEEISDADENSDLNELSQENELEEREYHAEIITEQN